MGGVVDFAKKLWDEIKNIVSSVVEGFGEIFNGLLKDELFMSAIIGGLVIGVVMNPVLTLGVILGIVVSLSIVASISFLILCIFLTIKMLFDYCTNPRNDSDNGDNDDEDNNNINRNQDIAASYHRHQDNEDEHRRYKYDHTEDFLVSVENKINDIRNENFSKLGRFYTFSSVENNQNIENNNGLNDDDGAGIKSMICYVTFQKEENEHFRSLKLEFENAFKNFENDNDKSEFARNKLNSILQMAGIRNNIDLNNIRFLEFLDNGNKRQINLDDIQNFKTIEIAIII
jgi:hypothetical protein